jgi:predicted ABC-type transport system involved in lysophospholipase L1 biosynthesis ATPase subunit
MPSQIGVRRVAGWGFVGPSRYGDGARALANRPAIILADEPAGNLDRKTGKRIVDLRRRLVVEKLAIVILLTHDLSVAARADRTLDMQDGRLMAG